MVSEGDNCGVCCASGMGGGEPRRCSEGIFVTH